LIEIKKYLEISRKSVGLVKLTSEKLIIRRKIKERSRLVLRLS